METCYPHSRDFDEPVDVTFTNNFFEYVELYWYNDLGDEIYFDDIEAGASLTVNTFVSHVWAAYDEFGDYNIVTGGNEFFTAEADASVNIEALIGGDIDRPDLPEEEEENAEGGASTPSIPAEVCIIEQNNSDTVPEGYRYMTNADVSTYWSECQAALVDGGHANAKTYDGMFDAEGNMTEGDFLSCGRGGSLNFYMSADGTVQDVVPC